MSLPGGVVKINPGEECPPKSLCLYRDGQFTGPGYAVGAGYPVDLNDLPCDNCNFGPTMAGNVSSWYNRTDSTAELIDKDNKQTSLPPGEKIDRGPTEDKIVKIAWKA
jgi:Peptidase inhibitor family I36